jgi:membrane fusion protein, copper/silver efflux system
MSTGGDTPDTSSGPRAHEPPPPGARFMNGVRWAMFAGLLVLAALSFGGYFFSRSTNRTSTQSTKATLYHCPMHPSYTSDKPGECPICGMALEPVRLETGASADPTGDVPGLTSVQLDPDRIQMIGVRHARVERRSHGGQLDLVGFLAPDESRVHRVQLRVAGWVQQLFVSRTGEFVRAGAPLLSIYSPELYQSEREYLIEIAAHDAGSMSHGPNEMVAGRQRLRLLGVPDVEVERLEREREPATNVVIRAPVSGTVLERSVAAGQYVDAETPLFTITDLSRLWVLADLYEMDFARAHPGDRAVFMADALPGRAYDGRVEFVYPTVSSETRTLKLRVPLANAGGVLRPGMYGRVRLIGRESSALAVPAEAIVNTGEQDYVFLARAGGRFEPRRVRTGTRDGEWIEILGGVAEGDTVVASASFLIDSESRLKAAIAGMGAQPSTEHRH